VLDWESGHYHTNLVVFIAEPFRLENLSQDFGAVAIRHDPRSDTVLGQKRYLQSRARGPFYYGYAICICSRGMVSAGLILVLISPLRGWERWYVRICVSEVCFVP
jgi:hypothetical protein